VINSESGLEAEFTLEDERGNEIENPPFRILVLGDWSGDADKKTFGNRRPFEIDRDNFDEVLARYHPRLELEQSDETSLTLEFRSLDDFHPDQIFRQLPMFERLRDLRKRLLSSSEFRSAAEEVRSWFQVDEPAKTEKQMPEPSGSEGSVLDAILSGAPVPAKPKVASDQVAALIKDLVRPHLVSVDESEQAALLAAVDAATSDLMRRILHDHKFQALEAAWRGLYLLVRRAETSTELKICLFDANKEELTEDLRSVSDLSGSNTYKLLVREPIETAEQWTAIAANYAFLPVKDDVATLVRIAKICAAADAPFISHIRPEVLGLSSLYGNEDPAGWRLADDSDASKLWAVLRGIPEAAYLGMTIPRFLARLPYGRETEPLETFQFEEFPDEPDHDKYLWSNASFIAALLLAKSFAAYGWQMDGRIVEDVEDLPLHVYKSKGETVFQPCAEVLLTETGCEQLMEKGLMPLVSFKNTDRVRLARFQSISDPLAGLRGRWA
jgi:type VI secretion system protein ImpC